MTARNRSKVQAPGIVRDPDGGFRLFYTGVGLTFAPDAGIRVAPDPQVLLRKDPPPPWGRLPLSRESVQVSGEEATCDPDEKGVAGWWSIGALGYPWYRF